MLRTTLVALAFLAVPGLVRAAEMKMDTAMHAGAADSPSDKGYSAAMTKMMTDMNSKPTGHPDKDFVTMMLPHHQGAVDMAKVELQYGKDPMLLELARGIVESQNKEIAEMRDWLAKHGK